MPDDLARLEVIREGLIATQRALEQGRKAHKADMCCAAIEVFCAAIVVLPISFFLIRAVVIGQLSMAFLLWGIIIGLAIGGLIVRGYHPDSKVGLIFAVVPGAIIGAPILEPRDERPKVVRELLSEIERRIAVVKSSESSNDVRP